MESFRCNGEWWIPGADSKRVFGTLHFSPDDGIRLELAGVLGDPHFRFQEKRIPIVLGFAYNLKQGSRITIRGATLAGIHNSPHLLREDYIAERLYVGDHLGDDAAFRFTRLKLNYSGLSSWATDLHGLAELDSKTEGGNRVPIAVGWSSPPQIKAQMPGGELTIGAGCKFSMSRRSASLNEHIGITIHLASPEDDESLNKRYVYQLQNFFTLATDHPNALVEFECRPADSSQDVHIYESRVFSDVTVAADLLPHKMLFTQADAGNRAPTLCSRWIELGERLRGICEPYFGVQYKPGSFADTNFLIVFQSLVLYERRRSPIGEISETSLLAILLDEHAQTVGLLFGPTEVAVQEVFKFRNYLVHRDSSLGDEPDYTQRLFWLTQKLMMLMKACLLTELDFTVAEQKRLFDRNQMFIHLMSLSASQV
jgi:hypothetical protein